MSTFASKLTERVTFQQQTLTDDGYGGQTASWADFATVFAQVQPIYVNWRERDVGDQLDASAGYRVIVRIRHDIAAAMRILWKTHVLAIHSINESDIALSILTYEEHL